MGVRSCWTAVPVLTELWRFQNPTKNPRAMVLVTVEYHQPVIRFAAILVNVLEVRAIKRVPNRNRKLKHCSQAQVFVAALKPPPRASPGPC